MLNLENYEEKTKVKDCVLTVNSVEMNYSSHDTLQMTVIKSSWQLCIWHTLLSKVTCIHFISLCIHWNWTHDLGIAIAITYRGSYPEIKYHLKKVDALIALPFNLTRIDWMFNSSIHVFSSFIHLIVHL